MNKRPVPADEYFLQQHTRCRKYLHAYNLKKNNEDLHQLRVSIKKIKAILQMLNELQPRFKLDKSFTPYHNIFRHLGPIREELLQREKLKGDSQHRSKTKRSGLVSMLNKELKTATTGYLKATENALPVILASLRKVDHNSLMPFCKKLFKNLKRDWKRIKTDKGLHQYRKQIKLLLYCSKLLTTGEKNKFISDKKLNRLNKLQDIIGEWHDNDMLLSKILKDGLDVSPQFLHYLKNETKALKKRAYKKGDKL